MNGWVLDNAGWLLALVSVLAVAALVLTVLLWRALQQQRARFEELDIRFGVLEEHSQRELLAMGQRIIEAEKMVRRFSDRIEAVEVAGPAEERYGQLGSLLAGKLMSKDADTASAAELALKSLLQRGKD